MGEQRGVYCEDLGENWPSYNGIALYFCFDIVEIYHHNGVCHPAVITGTDNQHG